MSVIARLRYHLARDLAGPVALRLVRWEEERRARRRRPAVGDPLTPPLLSTLRMKEIMARHYLEARHADGVRKVAWVASGTPVEILRALGFLVFYIDNHAALCGARRQAESLSEVAEEAGYSRDICSYVRTDVGVLMSGRTPIGRLPKPDLIVCCNNICQTILGWYRILAAHTGAPMVNIDTPFLYGPADGHQVDFVKRQLEEMIPVAERVAGRRLSFARLREVTRLGQRAAELWMEILDRAKHRPAPIGAFDAFINMGPVVTLRGEPAAVDFYQGLLAEVDHRLARGIGIVRHERKRVLWDNLPVWHRIGWLSRRLAEAGVALVVSNYTYAWGELAPMFDPDNPIESTARVYLHAYLNRSTGDKLDGLAAMARDFQLDGAILHSDRSCKPYSLGQIDQRGRLVGELGLPALLLEADHNDPRVFSEEQVATRLAAFVETME